MPQKGLYERVSGSGVWWIRYADENGRIRREKAGTKSQAQKLYLKRKADVIAGRKLPELSRRRAVGFKELADDCLEYSRSRKASYGDDECRMAKLVQAFGERQADAITPQEIERWFNGHPRWRPATANRYKALLSLTYRLGVENGKVAVNPARLLKGRREDNGRIRWLQDDEEVRLRNVISTRCPSRLPELDLALNTGLRKGEQYGLHWSDINLESRLLTVARSKNGDVRHVPLNDVAISALKRLRDQAGEREAVFDIKDPREWFKSATAEAGVTCLTWHCLRHTFASRLVMAGVDLRTVQELMGHRTIQMTIRYSHLAPQHKASAVQMLCSRVQDLDKKKRAYKRSALVASARGKQAKSKQICEILEKTDTKTSTNRFGAN
jgi:integrase